MTCWPPTARVSATTAPTFFTPTASGESNHTASVGRRRAVAAPGDAGVRHLRRPADERRRRGHVRRGGRPTRARRPGSRRRRPVRPCEEVGVDRGAAAAPGRGHLHLYAVVRLVAPVGGRVHGRIGDHARRGPRRAAHHGHGDDERQHRGEGSHPGRATAATGRCVRRRPAGGPGWVGAAVARASRRSPSVASASGRQVVLAASRDRAGPATRANACEVPSTSAISASERSSSTRSTTAARRRLEARVDHEAPRQQVRVVASLDVGPGLARCARGPSARRPRRPVRPRSGRGRSAAATASAPLPTRRMPPATSPRCPSGAVVAGGCCRIATRRLVSQAAAELLEPGRLVPHLRVVRRPVAQLQVVRRARRRVGEDDLVAARRCPASTAAAMSSAVSGDRSDQLGRPPRRAPRRRRAASPSGWSGSTTGRPRSRRTPYGASSWPRVSVSATTAGLHRVVGRHPGRVHEPGERGDVDDPARALALEHRHEGAAAADHAEQVDLDDPLPLVEPGHVDPAAAGDAGVVDQEVEPAPALLDPGASAAAQSSSEVMSS